MKLAYKRKIFESRVIVLIQNEPTILKSVGIILEWLTHLSDRIFRNWFYGHGFTVTKNYSHVLFFIRSDLPKFYLKIKFIHFWSIQEFTIDAWGRCRIDTTTFNANHNSQLRPDNFIQWEYDLTSQREDCKFFEFERRHWIFSSEQLPLYQGVYSPYSLQDSKCESKSYSHFGKSLCEYWKYAQVDKRTLFPLSSI